MGLPPIPPDGQVGTTHVIEDVPFGWDVVVELRQLRPDLCDCRIVSLAILHLAGALRELGGDPLALLEEDHWTGPEEQDEDPSRLDEDDDGKGVYE